MKIKKIVSNNHGDLTIGTVFLIMFLISLIAILITFTKVQIQCVGITDTVKLELNNLSATIAEDTYRAMREGNLTEYDKVVNMGNYYTKLSNSFKQSLQQHLPMKTEDYEISNSSIRIRELTGRIQYRYVAKVRFQISMFGKKYPGITRNIVLTGYLNTKY